MQFRFMPQLFAKRKTMFRKSENSSGDVLSWTGEISHISAWRRRRDIRFLCFTLLLQHQVLYTMLKCKRKKPHKIPITRNIIKRNCYNFQNPESNHKNIWGGVNSLSERNLRLGVDCEYFPWFVEIAEPLCLALYTLPNNLQLPAKHQHWILLLCFVYISVNCAKRT